MFGGYYTAASGMFMNQRAIDVTANNMANIKTSGYKSKRLVKTTFDEELVRQMNGRTQNIGRGSTISVMAEQITNQKQGSLQRTGRTYDLAINGDGFFVIQGENGRYLTRNGNFETDADGNLVLPGVGQVMGDGGPITVDAMGFKVGESGIIYDNEDGELDQLQVVIPNDYGNLIDYDNGTYGVADAANLQQVYPGIFQGSLESAGVSLNDEMTRTMELQRAFQSLGKAITIVDQMNQRTASEVGKL